MLGVASRTEAAELGEAHVVRITSSTLGAPAGGRGSSGHHGSESHEYRLILPWNDSVTEAALHRDREGQRVTRRRGARHRRHLVTW